MALDSMFEGVVRFIVGIVRFLGEFVIELIFEVAVRRFGRLVLRVLTWGYFPFKRVSLYNRNFFIASGVIGVIIVLGAILMVSVF